MTEFVVGQYVELYPTIPARGSGSIRGGTRGIIDAVDLDRPAGDCYFVTFLWNERRTVEAAWLRGVDLFAA
jgi:hypothetical protein